MMKVLHIGGEDVHLRIPILTRLRSKGFRVGALGCKDIKPFKDTKIPYLDYSLTRWISPYSDIKTRKQLRYIFDEARPNLVHVFDTKPGVLIPKIAKESGVNLVVRTVTGMGYVFSSKTVFAQLLKPLYRIAQKKAIYYTDMVIFQNKDDQEYFEKNNLVPIDKSVLVASSGLHVKDFISKKLSDDEKCDLRENLHIGGKVVVTMISRMVKDKGVLEFLKAARILANNNIMFLLVGPIDSEGKQSVSKSTIASYSQYVKYIGPVKNVVNILSISDIFVLPSYYREGLPRILLEAGALGLPLITTDMPGCRDVVSHGWNGLLVPTRDPRALADAISILESNKKLRIRMGARNPDFIKNNFDLSIITSAYSKIYKKLSNGTAMP